MPRELLDRAKALASEKTGIPTERMLISATHTHSAPAAMGALGCPADPAYVALLPGRIAEAIERAAANLVPARVGWAAIDDDRHTFCRRWIRRPDRMLDDPFGNRTVRANMHPGYRQPRRHRPVRPGRPGPDRAVGPDARGPADRRPGQLLACTTSAPRPSRPTTTAGSPRRWHVGSARSRGSPPVRRHHVAGDQRRPDVDGLRPAQATTRASSATPTRSPSPPSGPTRRSPRITTGCRWPWPRPR